MRKFNILSFTGWNAVFLLSIFYANIALAGVGNGDFSPWLERRHRQKKIELNEYTVRERIQEERIKNSRLSGVQLPSSAVIIARDINTEEYGDWSVLEDGTRIWNFDIHSPGAWGLVAVLRDFQLPEGVELYFDNEVNGEVEGPITSAHNRTHGMFTSRGVPGEDLLIRLIVPADVEIDSAPFSALSINALFNINTQDDRPEIYGIGDGNSLGENVDVACYDNDDDPENTVDEIIPPHVDWHNQIASVGVIRLAGGLCHASGFLVNNTRMDGKPLFMTASHTFRGCLKKEPNDDGITVEMLGYSFTSLQREMQIYWNYENATCRHYWDDEAGGAGSTPWPTDMTQGGTVVEEAIYPDSAGGGMAFSPEMAILELDSKPDVEYGVYYAGWDHMGNETPTVGVHHARGEVKRLSIDVDNFGYYTNTGNNPYKIFTEFELGVTESGSSGSPLFNKFGHAIGTCDSRDIYTALHDTWDEDDYQFKDHLDPMGYGHGSEDGMASAQLGCTRVRDSSSMSNGTLSGCIIIARENFHVAASSSGSVTFTASDRVLLRPGFYTSPGSTFTAKVN
ncbi:MAG: hypothetical protein JXR76_21875 [Deltaproteobacteria bacterium]|nr:hypothetical protein [Deltaproteobacteria bacterium]